MSHGSLAHSPAHLLTCPAPFLLFSNQFAANSNHIQTLIVHILMNAASFVSKCMCLKRECKVCHVSSFTHPHVIRNTKNDLYMDQLYRCPKNPKMFCEGRHMDEAFTIIYVQADGNTSSQFVCVLFQWTENWRGRGYFQCCSLRVALIVPAMLISSANPKWARKRDQFSCYWSHEGVCIWMDGWVKVCVQMCANIYVCLHVYISVCESTESKYKTEFSWESQYRCLISRPSSCAVDMFVIKFYI